MEECGTLVVSKNESQHRDLDYLLQMGNKGGVRGLRVISEDELYERKPYVVGSGALFSPTGAIVDSLGFLKSIADDAKELGAEYVM